jgi:hypothetical protein
VKRWQAAVIVLGVVLAAGCGRLFADRVPHASAPPDVKRVTFEIVARDNRCEPSVLAADRQGGALLITFQVTSVGKQHVFLIPDLDVRMTIPADSQVSIPVIAERSGIYKYGCTGLAWLGPLDAKGKLAIR